MTNMFSDPGRTDQSTVHHLSPKEQSLLAEIRKRKDELLDEIQQLKKDIAEVQGELDILDQADDGTKVSPKARQWSTGRNKFNRKAKEGIQYLIDCALLNNTPEDIALFLYKGEGLNKVEIGQYLGGHAVMNLEVLKNFVEMHQFEGMLLVEALRQFLWNFHLPGEAQSIDRMMEAFAQHYCQQNQDVFTSTDTCYVLSFSVIMLNTSLHNPNVKDKPTLEKFIIMNRGINNGGDLPSNLLQTLYENIKNEPFKVPDKDGDDITRIFFNPDIQGFLTKEGGSHKNWKKRYFILKDNCLYYFKNEGDKEPRGIIPLENLRVRRVNDSARRKFLFEIFTGDSTSLIKACKTNSEGKVVEGHHDVYRICASSEEERENWIKCINAMIIFDPFYDMLQTRKRRAIQSTISAP